MGDRPGSGMRRSGALVLVVVLAGSLASCSSTTRSATGASGSTTGTPSTRTVGRISLGVIEDPSRCDPIATGCLLPFPDDYFTQPDRTTPTGRRVHLVRAAMPANVAGVHIDPAHWNLLDGFSPGAAPIVRIPGLDLTRSHAAPITDIGSSLRHDAPVVLLDATTGRRLAYWTELDAQAKGREVPTLFVRPAAALPEGHRIVVALRGLVDHAGRPIAPSKVFRAYRDRLATGVAAVEGRRPAMERVFAELAKAGVARRDLQLAWDFTVASTQAESGWLLHMRDDAFARLGSRAPAFHVTQTTPSTDRGIAREVTGTYEVPLYLTGHGEAGSELDLGPDGLPHRNGTFTATFRCIVPTSATAAHPASVALYAHGLLGTSEQVTAATGVAIASNTVFCGTDLIGMAQDDIANAAKIAADLSTFNTLADRLLQGHLDTLFLGRLMIRPDGLGSAPAFEDHGASILAGHLSYYGLSQGGIMGAATTAVAQDWTRSVLGVPGADYSLLLDRSVDFDEFRAILDPAYPNVADRALGLQLIQMLWDRGEAEGYVEHVTSHPYEHTPVHEVLLQPAFGDHQVTNYATEVEARTLGLHVYRPVWAPGRSTEKVPFWGVPAIPSFPYAGSAVVLYDSGSPAPPVDNLPSRAGHDPHSDPRADPAAIRQIVAFLATGKVIDVCGGAACEDRPQG